MKRFISYGLTKYLAGNDAYLEHLKPAAIKLTFSRTREKSGQIFNVTAGMRACA